MFPEEYNYVELFHIIRSAYRLRTYITKTDKKNKSVVNTQIKNLRLYEK